MALISPIVFTALGIESRLFFTALAPIALAPFFLLHKKELFWFGAFSGLLWFYWVAFSLYYYDMLWLTPLLLLFIFFYYGGIFWFMGFLSTKFIWLRILLVGFLFDFLAPLGFDWMKPEMLYSGSYFGASKLDLIALLSFVAIIVYAKKLLKPIALVALIFAISPNLSNSKQLPPLKIELVNTSIAQDEKWNENSKYSITADNIRKIDEAIEKQAQLIVLPETAFPYFLNQADGVIDALKERSFSAAIITGALKLDGKKVYNSSYFFKDGQMYIFDKVVAVPFGEVNPLPKFMSSIVNELFFGGAQDYETAEKPSDFELGGVVFRNAICYEATNEKIYTDNPKFIVAMSNNAWFVPSFEPTIQKMLMRHFSKKHGSVIFHSVNKSNGFVLN